jgi:predicted N-acyltransferase
MLSAHWMRDPRLDMAVRDFCGRERVGIDATVEHLRGTSPLK